MRISVARALPLALCAAIAILYFSPARAQRAADSKGDTKGPASPHAALVNTYCAGCHNDRAKVGDFSLQGLDLNDPTKAAAVWEKVIRKVRVGAMPPQGMPRPDRAALDGFATYLETSLDRAAAANPHPGRASMHRLNRAEYANAIRDLLALEVDASALLPPDDESSGFDNIADVLKFSPSLMERYLSASWNVSRTAVGNRSIAPLTQIYRVPPDQSHDQHIDGLPLGTRGGIVAEHHFPLDAEYVLKVRLWRNTFDLMRGVEDPHDIEIAVDGERVKLVTIGGREDFVKMAENPGEYGAEVDGRLTVRLPLKAGVHTVTAAAVLRANAQREHLIKPFLRASIDGLDVTGDPTFDRLSIEGPFAQTGVSETPSRQRIFTCRPTRPEDESTCARQIIGTLTRRAYRRPLNDTDLETPLSFYQRARNKGGDFEAGVESALQFILASPEFLFRIEQDPANLADGAVYPVSDLALASRLAFFLWSSVPDDELVNAASQGKLRDKAALTAQIKRLIADPKARALNDNFAEQWLFLRNVKTTSPNMEAFPDFDDNLRQSMREETKLFFESILREDRSALDLLTADYTFVNERLARHYGMKGIYGSQFRRVQIADPNRRGLLGQASILTVTSYPNRTSLVQRGKWILTNLLGVPPTPPPPDVPELKEGGNGLPKSLRARMELHRENTVCAGCHRVMDPVGFALENFDGIGRWRSTDDGAAIDASGTMFEGSKVNNPADLRQMLVSRPEVFVGVLTEKLLTYALGRGLDYADMPTVRKIVRDARASNYKFSALIEGVVNSVPFQMRQKRPAVQVAGN